MRDLLVQNLNPKVLVSWPVFLASLFWSVLAHFLDISNNPPGLILERFFMVLISHLAMFGTMWILVKAISRFSQLSQALLMIAVIAISSSVRGMVLWVLFVELGLHSGNQLLYRALVAIPILGIPVTLFAITTYRVRGYSEARKIQLVEGKRLQELKEKAQEAARESAEARLQQIKQTVFDSLGLSSQGSNSKTIDALNETIENVVRPLSHQIDKEESGWVSEAPDTSKIRINWYEVAKNALLPKFIHPMAVALSVSISGSIFMISQYPPLEAGYLIFVSGAVPWLVLWFFKSVLLDNSDTKPVWAIRLGMLIGLLLSGFLTGSATLVATLSTDDPIALFFNGQYFVLALALFFALASSAQAQARATSEKLLETTTNLAWEVARITDEQRQLRRSLAHALHGPLQAGLTSAKIRLQTASASDPDSIERVDSAIRAELRNLVESITLQSGLEVASFDEILRSLNQTWDGVARVSLKVNGVTESALKGDLVLMSTLNDLFNELTFNAIKHGGATSIEFEVELKSLNTISLVCIDNGSQPAASGRIGLGTKLLDECALSWDRVKNDSGTKTSVVLPFSAKAVVVKA